MPMKKFINDPADPAQELLAGFATAHSDTIKVSPDRRISRANPKSSDKVAVVTLGGAGHEPALSGFVGEGMLDVSVVGDIFAAPGPPVARGSPVRFNSESSRAASFFFTCPSCGSAARLTVWSGSSRTS